MVDPLRAPPPPVRETPPAETPGERRHVVREHETLDTIATDHHTTPKAILDRNPQVRDPDLLSVGEVLDMPDVTVAPDVTRSVDAVLAPGATAGLKNEAYARVQDHVDANGGIGAQGVAREALPAQAADVLADAGLPTIDARAIAAVDRTIGPGASFEQRLAGYRSVGDYVESVGGVGDSGITAEYLPARASQLLRDAGTDVRLRQDTIEAVNRVLADDATPADIDAAYTTVQDYVDQVGGIGDAGIVAEALPLRAVQLLNDAGNPALRFDPRVIDAVDRVIVPGASDAQQISGYQSLQNYVDDVGGIGDSGITADYLPARAAELLRETGVEVSLDTPAGASVDTIVQTMEAGATPAEQVRVLGDAYAQADAPTRQALLADPQVQQALRSAAFAAVEPLSKPPEGANGPAAPFLEAANNLDALTRDLDPALVAAVLQNAVPGISAYALNEYGGPTAIDGSATFLRVLDRAAGTPEGDAAIRALVDTGIGLDRNGIYQHLSSGGTPAFTAAAGYREATLEGVNSFASGTLSDSAQAYLKHTEELNWLIRNQGGTMTPEQLDRAVQDYIARQEQASPGWQARADELKEQLAQDGLELQSQIETLLAAGGYESEVDALLADPTNQFALTTVLGNHPEAVTDRTLSLLSGLGKNTEAGRRTLEIAANAYIKAQVAGPLASYDPADARSVAQVQTVLDRLRTPGMATALGIDQPKLDSAVQAIRNSMQGPGASQARLDAALDTVDKDLNKLALSSSTPAGQLFRALGVGLAGINLASSLQRAGRDPGELANWGKVATDTLGVSQKTAEIMFARGVGGAGTEAFASRAAGRIVGGLSAAADGWLAVSSFAKGDTAMGTLYTVAAAGGALATASAFGVVGVWGGPVGIGLTAIAALGAWALQSSRDSSIHHNDPDTARFLEFAGLDADTAAALTDQSGDGHSPVPVLLQYAEYRGYDMSKPAHQQAFADWLDNLPEGALTALRDGLHQKLDDWDGDASRLGSSTDQPPTDYDVNPSTGSATPRITVYSPGTVGEIDALLTQRGYYGGSSVLPDAPPAP